VSESEFTKAVVEWLKPYVSGYEIASKKSVLYTLSVDESGAIQLGVDAEKNLHVEVEPALNRIFLFLRNLNRTQNVIPASFHELLPK
jgi:hypothetical protein